jgi:hypothetical protein
MPEKTAVIDSYAGLRLPDAAAESLPWITVKDLLWFLYYYPFRLLSGRLPRRMLYWIAGPLFQLRFRSQRKRAAEAHGGIPRRGHHGRSSATDRPPLGLQTRCRRD